MEPSAKDQTEIAMLRRVLNASRPNLSREAARSLLALEFPPDDQQRMHVLAAKARAGNLTRREQKEIDAYGLIGSMVSILKSKARVALKKAGESK